MAKKLRVLISDSHNPWFNIATEDWIFREMDPEYETLYLWRNDKTVVIGRTQNPWTECNLARMEQDGVYLARRVSGGGAVYHDLGNSIFTFLSPRATYSRDRNNQILIGALKRFGIAAEVSGRNDLVIPFEDGPRKFSGSAFRETRDRAFHHGTLLLHSDLDRLSLYLTPNPKKLQSKGKTSVRSRVVNLCEVNESLNHTMLTQAIIESFFDHHQATCEIQHLSPDELGQLPELQQRFSHFSDWDWRFGQSPSFTHVMSEYLSWGFFEVHIQAEDGKITDCRVFSDTLFPDLIEPLQKALVGKRYHSDGLKEAAREVMRDEAYRLHVGSAEFVTEFFSWLEREVEV